MTSIAAVGLLAVLGTNSKPAAVPMQVTDRAAVVLFDPSRLDLDEAELIARVVYGDNIQMVTEDGR